MVSLFTLHCLESLNIDQCFGSCTKKRKCRVRKKCEDESESESESEHRNELELKARSPTYRRRFSSVPQTIAIGPQLEQLPCGPLISPPFYGVSATPRSRLNNINNSDQVISIRRRKYAGEEPTTVKHIKVRPRPNTWTAKAPRLPIDFGIGNGQYSVCVINMSKVVAHISGDGFIGMMRHPDTETQGLTINQMFTTRFANLMNMLFDTSVKNSASSVICVVCDNVPRNIVSYPVVVKGKMEGLMFLWCDDILPHQEIAEMIHSAVNT